MTYLTPEQSVIFQQRWTLAATYRGLIINRTTDIEFLMEMIISHFFCSDAEKANEIRHRLICDGTMLTFESKLKLFRQIIHIHFKDFKTKYPNLVDDIQKLQKIRNIVCHRKILTTDESLSSFDGDNIYFENFEVVKDNSSERHQIKQVTEPVNKSVVNEYAKVASSIVPLLEELLLIVRPPSDASGKGSK